jgi:hypothetical protein
MTVARCRRFCKRRALCARRNSIVSDVLGNESPMASSESSGDHDATRHSLLPVRPIPTGGARRDRTDDLMLAKHALSQLSYGPVMVGLGGLEPPTSRLSSARSNQLSYKPFSEDRGRSAEYERSVTCSPSSDGKKERRRGRFPANAAVISAADFQNGVETYRQTESRSPFLASGFWF